MADVQWLDGDGDLPAESEAKFHTTVVLTNPEWIDDDADRR